MAYKFDEEYNAKIPKKYQEKNPPKDMGKSINRGIDKDKYLMHTMSLMAFAPLDCKYCKAEEITQRAFDYFNLCGEQGIKPTVAGLSQAIGVGREALLNYINGKVIIPLDNQNELRRAYGMLNTLVESYMIDNKIAPISAIFMMKNNFGYKDASEVISVDNRDNKMSAEELVAESNLMLSDNSRKADIEFEVGKELITEKGVTE